MNRSPKTHGFTLIEVMVAVSIFTIVVTIGIAALISMHSAYYKTSGTRQSVSAVSSALEYISRQIRTAQYVDCGNAFLTGTVLSPTSTRSDCNGSSSFSLVNQEGQQVAISFSEDPVTNRGSILVTKAFVTGSTSPQLTGATTTDSLTDGSVVDIDSLLISVDGTNPLDTRQTAVRITVAGSVVGRTNQEFSLQTTVTPRILDIPPTTN
jgi:prepilin-type N-terminal cleavage/methylation domain-containing protein